MSTTFTAHYTVVGKLTLFWALLLQLITNYCTPTIVHQLLYTSNYCIAIRKQILNWRYTQKAISWHSNTSMRPNKSVWAGRSWSSIHCTSIKPSSDHLMLIKRSSDADYMIINPLNLDLNNLRTASPFKLRFLSIIILASSSALLSSLSSQYLSFGFWQDRSPALVV